MRASVKPTSETAEPRGQVLIVEPGFERSLAPELLRGEEGLTDVAPSWPRRSVGVTWARLALPATWSTDMGAVVWVVAGRTDVGRGGALDTYSSLADEAGYVRELVPGGVWVEGGEADAAVPPVTLLGRAYWLAPRWGGWWEGFLAEPRRPACARQTQLDSGERSVERLGLVVTGQGGPWQRPNRGLFP